MKPTRILATVIALVVLVPLASIAGTPIDGTWSLAPGRSADDVRLTLHYSGFCSRDDACDNTDEEDFSLASLGLRASDLDGPMHDVSFHMSGDAGDVAFTGSAGNNGLGAGRFTFTPSDAYVTALARDGVSAPTVQEQLGALLMGVTIAYVQSIVQAGVREHTFRMYLAFKALDVDATYARAMEAAEPGIATHDLIAFRALHISPDYVASFAAIGYNHLAPHDLITFRALHIDAAFIVKLERSGYAHPSPSAVVRYKVLGARAQTP